jgi:hypothetical protein
MNMNVRMKKKTPQLTLSLTQAAGRSHATALTDTHTISGNRSLFLSSKPASRVSSTYPPSATIPPNDLFYRIADGSLVKTLGYYKPLDYELHSTSLEAVHEESRSEDAVCDGR